MIQNITKKYLIEKYIVEDLTMKEIAKLNNYSWGYIRNKLEKFSISKNIDFNKFLTSDFLIEEYINKENTIEQISKKIGCSTRVIRLKLIKYNIPRRKKCIINKNKKGSECSNWRGGITSLHILIRYSPESRVWRERVFKRDSYICRECGRRGGKLEAHHIKEFSKILQEFLQSYADLNPIKDKELLSILSTAYSPFWQIDNGETLCYKCHTEKR